MYDTTLCSYRTWSKRHHLVDRYDGGNFLWGQLDLSNVEQNICKYCGSVLTTGFAPSRLQKVSHFYFNCDVCGWWKLARILESGLPVEDVYVAFGSIRRFNVGDLEIPLLDLRTFLEKRPDCVSDVHSTAFEKLVRDCLRTAYPGSQVFHVGSTGDGGTDIKLITTSGDTYLVQVKRRRNLELSEGVQAIRELNGVLFREGLAKGMVVSTARRFTKAAKMEARVRTVTKKKYEMKLVAFDEFMNMLRSPGPHRGRPWQLLLDREDADFGMNHATLEEID